MLFRFLCLILFRDELVPAAKRYQCLGLSGTHEIARDISRLSTISGANKCEFCCYHGLSEHNYHASIVIPWLFSCLGERHWAWWKASSYIKVRNFSNFFHSSHWLSLYFEVKLKSSSTDSVSFVYDIQLTSRRTLYKSSSSISSIPYIRSLFAFLSE